MKTCPFCCPDPSRVFVESAQYIGLWDAFPVTPGHALVIPRRHVADWFHAERDEQIALLAGIEQAKAAILKNFAPAGFNVGINVGAAAGQTVPHLHVHVIPRYEGDVPDATGGIRNVIPNKGNYLRTLTLGTEYLASAPHPRALISGETDPLLPHLLAHLDRATAADICVAFVQLSGLRLTQARLQDFLSRGGRLRLLTGDYLDITDPQALHSLLDLEGKIELRIFETKGVSFHPKSYLLHLLDGSSVALVGSSNLTGSALQSGIEWNFRAVTSANPTAIRDVQAAFDQLFTHPSTQALSVAWIKSYAARRQAPQRAEIAVPVDPLPEVPEPHRIQQEALQALETTRMSGNSAGLVVLATGLGKTWLSAFDSNRPGFERVLFVAHREEILSQAVATFRRIRPNAVLGRYTGTEKLPEADVLFGSIQTLGSLRHLRTFEPDRFDYIIVDEFHHAAATTYRNLIAHFTPKFMLGLTATPERTDGGDLLALCQENQVYSCDLVRGIREELLCPFHYYGVPDEVDYRNIPWRNNRFDEEALTTAVATQKRAQNALEQYRTRAGKRTLAFCVSQRHADFMAEFFGTNGLRAVAVHSGPASAPRSASLEAMASGALDVIFAVDLFNEGIDLPAIDTVMMLRPTESAILWMQQFGRGLRKSENKPYLTVIDYIGNHRIFLNKPRTLLGLPPGDQCIDRALNLLFAGEFQLPPGCEVTYELKAVEVLRSLLRRSPDAERAYYMDFRERHGQRPTASEAYHDGYNPRSVRRAHGSWFQFVEEMGDLSTTERDVLRNHRAFFDQLEITPMTKSFKMLTLLAMLNRDAFPGAMRVEDLADAFAQLAGRSAVFAREIGGQRTDRHELIRLLETNPIDAWTGGRGTGDHSYFSYEQGVFAFRASVPPGWREPFQALAREIVEWRLAEYLARSDGQGDTGKFSCKVSHSDGRPILFLDRLSNPSIPSGWTTVEAEGERFEANFVKIAVNVLRRVGDETNMLGDLLKKWFGPDAGLPGTSHRVVFEQGVDTLVMAPERRITASAKPLELWQTYMREEIPPLFGLAFSQAIWNAGFIAVRQHIFLLVTLEKEDLLEGHRYHDHFLSPNRFEWQSQNRTTQQSKHGQMLKPHQDLEIPVHLFVRRAKKNNGKPAPFYYCGDVSFISWRGEKPITIEWQLPEPVPGRLQSLLLLPGA